MKKNSLIMSAIEYNRKINSWISRIKARITINRNSKQITLSSPDSTLQRVISDNVNESSLNAGNSSLNSNNVTVKLPKLAIKKYICDPCLWMGFWNQFQALLIETKLCTKLIKFHI